MHRARTVGIFTVLAVVLVELAVLVLGGAGSECGDACTSGQRAADVALALLLAEVGVAVLVAVPLGVGYLVREGLRESRRERD